MKAWFCGFFARLSTVAAMAAVVMVVL